MLYGMGMGSIKDKAGDSIQKGPDKVGLFV